MSKKESVKSDNTPIWDQSSIGNGDIGNTESKGSVQTEVYYITRSSRELGEAFIGAMVVAGLEGYFAGPLAVRSTVEGAKALKEGEWSKVASNTLETGLLALPIILAGIVGTGFVREVIGKDKDTRRRLVNQQTSSKKR